VQVEAIWAYNQEKWGGRFNPLIFTDGSTIEANWWKLLKDVDPDVVKCLTPIRDELAERINTSISPLLLERPDKNEDDSRYFISPVNGGVRALPTPQSLKRLAKIFLFEPKLAVLRTERMTDELSLRFIRLNFGVYSTDFYVQKALEPVEKEEFVVADRAGLAAALHELGRPPGQSGQFVYPLQFCALPNTARSAESSSNCDAFAVIVGDSIKEVAYLWNRIWLIPQPERVHLNQIWIPTAFVGNPEMETALRAWLPRMGEHIHFVSFTLEESTLKGFASRLVENTLMYETVDVLQDIPFPTFASPGPHLQVKEGMDLYRATGVEEHLTLSEPGVIREAGGKGHWMADVYIQAQTGRNYGPNVSFSGRKNWWQLPRRNFLTHQMFSKPARVNRKGIPSVMLHSGKPDLTIKLPDETNLFYGLVMGDPELRMGPKKVARPFDNIRQSDKGRYLTGFLEIFSGLFTASHTLSERFWRRMFDVMSHRDPLKEQTRLASVRNTLAKNMQKFGADFQAKDEGLDWLAEYVLRLSRDQAVEGKERTFRYFREQAEKELEEFNKSKNEDWVFDAADVENAISDLLELNVLLIGVRQYCPRCGTLNWYPVDEVGQSLLCKGCRYSFIIRPEHQWYYKLNTLVQAGIAEYGLTPVVITLGQLLSWSFNSFFYAPSLELLKSEGEDSREYKSVGDLDIVCVLDGKFIIGEIKQSVGLFKPSDFEKMADLAEVIRPDLVLFSSLNQKPTRTVSQSIDKVKRRLEPLEIEAEWFELSEHIFEPSPVR
jgi:hypothetical protein